MPLAMVPSAFTLDLRMIYPSPLLIIEPSIMFENKGHLFIFKQGAKLEWWVLIICKRGKIICAVPYKLGTWKIEEAFTRDEWWSLSKLWKQTMMPKERRGKEEKRQQNEPKETIERANEPELQIFI